MAKLIASVTLISVLLVVIANASAYRTIITTVEIDEQNPRGQSCRQEIERQDLSACESYVRQSRRGSYDKVLAIGEGQNQQQQLRQCCNQIQRVRDDCQCEALKYVVQQQQMRGGQRGEYQRAMQRASNIPSACGLRQSCDFRQIE